jgi:MFS family permease
MESGTMTQKSMESDAALQGEHTPDTSRFSRAFWLVSYAFFVTMFGTTTPAPLYVLYQERWHFSEGMITGIYAAYPLAVMAILLVLGRLSDQIGRRRVLLITMGCAILSSLIFISAQSVAWLFVGRIISGFSAGLCTSTATAALNELQPRKNLRYAAVVSTASNMLGLGTGPVVASVLAQFLPLPTILPYLAHIVLLLPAVIGLWTLPETVRRTGQSRWRPQSIGVPGDIRWIFVVASVSVFCAYSLLSVFTSLAPDLVVSLLRINNLVIGGLAVFIVFGFSALAQLLLRQVPERTNMMIGLAFLVIGLALTTWSLYSQSIILFLLSAICGGLGQGLAYMGSAMLLNHVAPVDRRGEVNSGYFAVGYLGADLPVLGLGLISGSIGVPAATLDFSIGIGVLSVITLVATLLLRVRQA